MELYKWGWGYRWWDATHKFESVPDVIVMERMKRVTEADE